MELKGREDTGSEMAYKISGLHSCMAVVLSFQRLVEEIEIGTENSES